MNNAHTFQRISAYVIDVFLISFIAALLLVFIPKSNAYKEAQKKEESLISDYTNKKINESEYIDQMYECRYIMDKEDIPHTLISIVLSLGYYVAFAYYNKGQTIGKKALHIRIVSNDGSDASYLKLLGRTLIHNGVLESILIVIFLLFIKSNQYSYTVGTVGIIQMLIMMSSVILISCRKDKRGLHDLIFNTRVIEN